MIKKAQFPTDENENTIPVLRLRPDGAHHIAVTAVSARNVVPFADGVRAVTITADDEIFVRFGNASVTAAATDHTIKPGIPYDLAIAGVDDTEQYTHVAAIRKNVDTILHISERF